MPQNDPVGLAAQIEDAVRAVPSVTNVFRAGSLVSNAVAEAATRLGGGDRAPLVIVTPSGQTTQIEVSIGVDAVAGVPATLRLVHQAIARTADAAGVIDRDVRITASHIRV
ncbi:hypothetical protein [Streptomyces sp. AC495_CC817]|uniref:hypothetical protein n=1 Tax=Streptomyces sp. AC495_CC817 TaxID=2823900 RepID=UPI001C27317F|nr:hypothetical protein [Streptomyces sp. AC495_CC817]